jgi:hypothetical protein
VVRRMHLTQQQVLRFAAVNAISQH